MGLFTALRSALGMAPALHTDQILQSLPFAEVRRDGKFHKRNYVSRDLEAFKCKPLTARTPIKNFQSFIAFDTETTGLGLTGNGIVEVSCVRFDCFAPTAVFSTLIHPKSPIPKDAIAVHHITNEMVQNAPSFHEIIPSLDEFIGKASMVAHNAPFDIRFLFMEGLDSIPKKKIYDTLAISQKLCKDLPDHKLGTCCKAYRIDLNNAHRSASDAMACGLLFVQFLMQNYGCRSVDEMLAKLKQ